MVRRTQSASDPMYSRRTLLTGAAAATLAPLTMPNAALSALPSRRQVTSLRFAVSASDRPRLLPLLADYERETGIAVIPVTFGNLYRALSVELTRGICSFDVVSIDDPWVAVFAGGRFLRSLDELGDAERRPLDLSDFLPSFLALGLAPDSTELFALPWVGNVQLYGYQASLFAEIGLDAPATWSDAAAAAATITKARAPATFGIGLRGGPGNAAVSTFLPLLRGHGTELFNASWEPQLETKPASSAMATLLELTRLAPPNVAETGHEELAVQLETGRVAQSADVWPTQLLGWSGQQMQPPVDTIAISRAPRQPGADPRPITGNWLLGVPAACSTTASAAFELIRWLTSPRQQLRLLLESGLPPTRISVMEDAEAMIRQPLLPTIAEIAKQASPRPRTHYFPAVEQIVGQWVADAMAGLVGGDEALANANHEIRAVMHRQASGPS